ncbi:hypothetical protein K503DRAFT_870727 [Rhizopogon vinicolor AM-OR11-026]|uniref:Uncharacterized protein n=1 Tax=Rhizopogon vinicolor AM-OR11-026 TaxID=1314800 RepID=A0A1B7MF18_9AGAM|nr:hypothetical protein K503DRAFT_870727 [Rhizopogon vinicolor AM-OR11-026]
MIMAMHLRGTYKCAKAVWPIFQKQKYGRIVTTSSHLRTIRQLRLLLLVSLKHSALKAVNTTFCAMLLRLQSESAGTAMTMTVWPQEMIDAYKPDYIAPVVGYLTSEVNAETTGQLFEISGGWAAKTRWQRAGGDGFPTNKALAPEDIISKWDVLTSFDDGRATHPTSSAEGMQQIMGNLENKASIAETAVETAKDAGKALKAKL